MHKKKIFQYIQLTHEIIKKKWFCDTVFKLYHWSLKNKILYELCKRKIKVCSFTKIYLICPFKISKEKYKICGITGNVQDV